MKRIMVQYKVKADRVEENVAYIQSVFEALQAAGPPDLRYASFKKEDGVSFVHVVSVESPDGSNPLSTLQAFQDFTADIKDRCDEAPIAVELTEVGAYNFFN